MPSSAAITADVLATANRVRAAQGRGPAFGLRVTGSGARTFRGLAEVVLPAPRSMPGSAADGLVVASLVATTEDAVTERLVRRDAATACRAIEAAVARGAEVAASCSAVFLVARSGVLDGRRATTTWWLAPVFRRMFPDVVLDADALVVTDGPVTTAGAAMAHLDLMLNLVARHCGAELADRCARFLLLDERRSQARYMALGFLAAHDEAIAKVERWARERLDSGVTVESLAGVADMGVRTLARRMERALGMSPVQFLQRLRVERAVELLESTTLSVEEIARRVGYAEPTTLRRLLRRELGRRPGELRVRS